MARLTLPDGGTVVRVEGDLEEYYRDLGWVDVAQSKADPDKPARKVRAKKK